MVGYLKGRLGPRRRKLILFAAIVLLPVLFLPVLPVWTMKLWAPQYPEGLTLTIYSNTIKGDLDKINTLNHYVGMRAITPGDFKEFTFLPLALTLFGIMALMAATADRRDVAMIGWIAFTLFAVWMFKGYADWLYRYGHELDPRAAIKLEAFTPPMIGFMQMANFKVWSLPAAGGILLGVAWLLGPIVVLMDHLDARRGAGAPPMATAA